MLVRVLLFCLLPLLMTAKAPVALAAGGDQHHVADAHPAAKPSFVYVKDGHLWLGDKPYQFASTNSYRMLESRVIVDETFDIMQRLGLKVVRFWGFANGEKPEPYDSYLYYNETPGIWPPTISFPEARWQQLDYVLKTARDRDLKVIMPLVNYWDRGVDVMARWTGQAPDQSQLINREVFYTLPRARTLYVDYVTHMLNRVNHLTGVAYKDDPTILMWEPINEARGRSDPSGATVTNWINWAAGVIKAVDPNHLVGPGSEGFFADYQPSNPEPGFNYNQHAYHSNRGESGKRWNPQTLKFEYDWLVPEGAYFPDDCELPNIDVCSVHGWPYNWFSDDDPKNPVFTGIYIREHRTVMTQRGLRKPLIVAEFGRQVARGSDEGLIMRDAIFKQTYREAAAAQVDGIGYWHLGFGDPDAIKDYLSFDVLCDPKATWDSTCRLIADYATKVNGP